jgi:acyl-CoA dehydrogenase
VADAVLVSHSGELVLLETQKAERALIDGVDCSLTWSREDLAEPLFRWNSDIDLRAAEACLLAVQMAGAMTEVFKRTLQYANDRIQFGRSIGKFQAVQHQLSLMAEQTAAASMAARMACATSEPMPGPLASAVAKSRASEAAVLVCGVAHAVHGAIGITEEFDLQLFTRRLHAWRAQAGTESYWNERVGRALLAGDVGSVPEFVRLELCPM